MSFRSAKPRTGRGKGRWSKREHESFLNGIAHYGKDWFTIHELYVPTRTPVQIRTHAQKYFTKIGQGRPFPEEPYTNNGVEDSGPEHPEPLPSVPPAGSGAHGGWEQSLAAASEVGTSDSSQGGPSSGGSALNHEESKGGEAEGLSPPDPDNDFAGAPAMQQPLHVDMHSERVQMLFLVEDYLGVL